MLTHPANWASPHRHCNRPDSARTEGLLDVAQVPIAASVGFREMTEAPPLPGTDELQMAVSSCSTSPIFAAGNHWWIFLTARCAAAYAAPPSRPAPE